MNFKVIFAIITSITLIGILGSEDEALKSSEFEVEKFYFPGDKIVVRANFEPKEAFIITPLNEKIEIQFYKEEDIFISEFELKKDIILGEYKIFVDGIEKSFFVDFCDLEIDYREGVLNLTAKTFFIEPRTRFILNSIEGEVVGNTSLLLYPGNNEFKAFCGKSYVEEKITVDFSIVYEEKIFATLDGNPVKAKFKVFADSREFEFFDFFIPEEIGSKNFTVYAEYKHLNKTKNFDFNIEVREVYFPGDIIVFRSDFAEKVEILDPIGKVHELKFVDGIAEFRLERKVILGEYRFRIDSFERRFFVDSYEIVAFFEDDLLRGRVFWHFFEPKSVEVIVGNEMFEVKLENGNFSFESKEKRVLVKCGNAEVFLDNRRVEVKDYHFLGDEIEILANFRPEIAIVKYGKEKIELKFHEDERFFRAKMSAEKPGVYEIEVDGLKKEFLVDSCEIKVKAVEKIFGSVYCLYRNAEFIEVLKIDGFEKIFLENGSFSLGMEGVLMLKYGNAKLSIAKIERTNYFVGEKIEIKVDFIPRNAFIVAPYGNFSLNFEDGFADFLVNQSGVYTLNIDGFERDFLVDNYSIEANFENGKILGRVRYLFIEPEEIYYNVSGKEGTSKLTKGNFEISLDLPAGKHFALLKCGNAEFYLDFNVGFISLEEFYFVGDLLELNLKFKPEKARLITPSKKIDLNFSELNGTYHAEFKLEEIGKHLIEIDGFERDFLVDNYSIEANFYNFTDGIKGKVSWNFIKPIFVKFKTEKEEGEAKVDDSGSFIIYLGGDFEFLEIKCGNAVEVFERKITLNRTFFIGEK
ncbi:MAG: hypothetical protein RMH75_07425, partial [Archaeoglobaceae archaeon]|nr:hypothetical protein [Archaeoglobaceae archaeon]MDW7990470.1 hypothetical protein [Archaeoglobaceae archaeon]